MNQKLLKFLVVFMGVLIVGGIITIVITIVNRAKFNAEIILPQHISTYESDVTETILVPPGFSIKNISGLEGNFLMWLEKGQQQEVWVLDSLKGRILRKFSVTTP